MKETKNSVEKQKLSVKNLAVRAATVLACATMCVAQTGLCTDTIVNNLVTEICGMLKYVGIVVVVIGVGKFALAMKDENPDGQTRAVYYAIAGAVLIGLKPIVDRILPQG